MFKVFKNDRLYIVLSFIAYVASLVAFIVDTEFSFLNLCVGFGVATAFTGVALFFSYRKATAESVTEAIDQAYAAIARHDDCKNETSVAPTEVTYTSKTFTVQPRPDASTVVSQVILSGSSPKTAAPKPKRKSPSKVAATKKSPAKKPAPKKTPPKKVAAKKAKPKTKSR